MTDEEELRRLAEQVGGTEMDANAGVSRDLYTAYRSQGFTDSEALYLTACATTGNPLVPPIK